VGHLQFGLHPEWMAFQAKKVEQSLRVFVLLCVRHTRAREKHVPPTYAHVFCGVDLDHARQRAQHVLFHDADVKHVTVLDEEGLCVLGVADRSRVGWHRIEYPSQRMSFH